MHEVLKSSTPQQFTRLRLNGSSDNVFTDSGFPPDPPLGVGQQNTTGPSLGQTGPHASAVAPLKHLDNSLMHTS